MTTAEVRNRLLTECEKAHERAFRASARAARHAVADANAVVEKVPIQDDPRAWLESCLAALAKLRESLLDPNDDDGWALGGVATVRNLVEAELERLPK